MATLKKIRKNKVEKNHFSNDILLINDFGDLLEFDINVDYFVSNPATIEYVFEDRLMDYTPEFLIKYNLPFNRSILASVLPRNEIRNSWNEFKPKFRAAKQYANSRGWKFKIYTEIEINGIYLENVKFLLQYRRNEKLPNYDHREIIMRILSSIKESTPDEILLIAFRDKNRQAELLQTLWQMVSTSLIGCNLFNKLTMKSCIWCITD